MNLTWIGVTYESEPASRKGGEEKTERSFTPAEAGKRGLNLTPEVSKKKRKGETCTQCGVRI